MTPTHTTITGPEAEIDPGEPRGALAEFYRAFNGRGLALMHQSWDSTGEASMDNPLGKIRRGWAEISATYERLLGGAGTVQVDFCLEVIC
jgi:hypothetical protein